MTPFDRALRAIVCAVGACAAGAIGCSGGAGAIGPGDEAGLGNAGPGGPGSSPPGDHGTSGGDAGAVSSNDGAAGGGEGGVALDGSLPGAFRHPGVLVTQPQLDFVKAKIAAGAEPWKSAFAAASASSSGSLSYAPAPIAVVVCGSYSNPDIGCTAEKADAIAAYTHALLWALGGDAAHADKAVAIMNAWSAVLKDHTNSNAPLQSAWVGSEWPRAAEILGSYAGWGATDRARFLAMLRDVYLPKVIGGAANENGNWELSMAEATIAISVAIDDATAFAKGVSMWRKRVPAYVYLTSDGPTPVGPPGGNATTPSQIVAYWFKQTTFVDGLAQETCRDLGHTQYGLAAITNAAETARIQGVDLYAEEAKRIAAGYEYTAQFLNGAPVPSTLCGGTLTSVKPDPMWEIGLNALANRRMMAMPQTKTLVAKIRPTGTDHHMAWETLTHAEVGGVGGP